MALGTRLAALVASQALLLAPARAQEIPCELGAAERLVAIGDVHGDYDRFVSLLRRTGVVDEKLRWAGGATHLVQTGDVLDRGPDSRKVMDLLMALEAEAAAAGGRVHALIGNHELWNVVGELGYVSDAELDAFDGPRDRELREQAGNPTARPGLYAHREAFGPEGKYGRWIRGHNAAVRIGDWVFVHGGITPEVARLGLPEINRRVRADLDAGEDWRQSFAASADGPLMTRRYSEDEWSAEEEARLGPEIAEALEILGAKTMVMGHTVTFGLIEPRFGGKAVLIDTGMLDVYLGGREAALVVEDGRAFAVYEKGRVALPGSLFDEAGARYIEEAVRASPRDDALKARLADVRIRQGRAREAAVLFREVGVLDPRRRLPLGWRRSAAEAFAAAGRDDEARRLYELYLEALETQARRLGRAGLPLLHRYARECLRLGLRTDEALAAARAAAGAYATNATFKVTVAWAYLEKGEADLARQILERVLEGGHDDFDTRFLLGRAYEALGRSDDAIEAYLAAKVHRPDDARVEEALAALGVRTP